MDNNTYLKYIEITPDHMESQISDEANFSNNEEGRAKIELMKKESEKKGCVGIVLIMEKPQNMVGNQNLTYSRKNTTLP